MSSNRRLIYKSMVEKTAESVAANNEEFGAQRRK